MRHAERSREPELAGYWAAGRGFEVRPIAPEAGAFEGMGDALPFAGRLIAGTGSRSNRAAWTALTAVS